MNFRGPVAHPNRTREATVYPTRLSHALRYRPGMAPRSLEGGTMPLMRM
jgi:hypothetical protein